FSTEPAFAATERPAGVLPVSVTAATPGCSISPATPSQPTTSGGKGPGGGPPRRQTSSSASAQPVTFEACLSSAPLPATRAGAAKRITCQNGKFQGITARTTPSGSKQTKLFEASVATGSRARKRAPWSA